MNKIYDVIVCGPAVGKTYLAKHDKRFIDLDQLKAQYKYEIINEEEFEKNKLNRGKPKHEDSLEFSLNLLKKEIKTEKIILISFNQEILNYILENKIDYCLVYPNLDSKEEYINRMRLRGNSEKFIEAMTNEKSWKEYYIRNKNDNRPKFKIELNKGEYLSDLKTIFFK